MSCDILFLAAHIQPYLIVRWRFYIEQGISITAVVQERDFYKYLSIPNHPLLSLIYYKNHPNEVTKELKLLSPKLVICSGWMYRVYFQLSNNFFKNKVPVILAMDTQWLGTWRQKMWALTFRTFYRHRFVAAWVPGERQAQYAQHLGFSGKEILYQLYLPDLDFYHNAYLGFSEKKFRNFPRGFLYIGRCEPHKLKALYDAYAQLPASIQQAWPLTIIGEGSMNLCHPYVKVIPFQSPEQLVQYYAQNAVFCLVSTDEPWGTVAHEAIAAGMPILISQQCGSSELVNDSHSILVDANSQESIIEGLLAFSRKQLDELISYSKNSYQHSLKNQEPIVDTYLREHYLFKDKN